MKRKIKQKQSRGILEEHAKSSSNFTSLGRKELYISIVFFLVGIIISLIIDKNSLTGIPFIVIGIFRDNRISYS